jgi:hypothetical protein
MFMNATNTMTALAQTVVTASSSGMIVYAPRSDGDITEEVLEWFKAHQYTKPPCHIVHYIMAIHTLWPSLYEADREASIRMAAVVLMDVAQLEGIVLEEDAFSHMLMEGINTNTNSTHHIVPPAPGR